MTSLPDLRHMHLAPEAGQMAIAPQTSALFPPDAHAALTHADMRRTTLHDVSERPALAFLDVTENCSRNSAAIAQAATNIPSKHPVKYMSVIVGAPGIAGLYLPENICTPLYDLAEKAATAALYRGYLGEQFIRMRLSTDHRPIFSPDWHHDEIPNIMLCAEKVGTLFMLTGGKVKDREIETYGEAEMMQAMPGMPVSFNKIAHSAPFLDEETDDKKFGRSSTVIFECYRESDDASQECASSRHIASVIRSTTGKDPRPMRYGLLT